ncbi:Uncharacterized protein APZ42_005475 [Daphnia magna]|uniref:Uncharacterized protein n=1 Tax=Daphnia magna TaxID=35525 RepID=A0A162CTC4_9CRUS|nr:Uncharacterized protein APZ42_005475 [Daphnia magna]
MILTGRENQLHYPKLQRSRMHRVRIVRRESMLCPLFQSGARCKIANIHYNSTSSGALDSRFTRKRSGVIILVIGFE